ncbi:MAG TPA: hypothetical protein VLA00_12815 [Xanthobacteraceae bacterium]|nr:hypothetical protein [Xanthobacteraceae bacterium]
MDVETRQALEIILGIAEERRLHEAEKPDIATAGAIAIAIEIVRRRLLAGQ